MDENMNLKAPSQDVLVAVEHFWPTLAIVKIGEVKKKIENKKLKKKHYF